MKRKVSNNELSVTQTVSHDPAVRLRHNKLKQIIQLDFISSIRAVTVKFKRKDCMHPHEQEVWFCMFLKASLKQTGDGLCFNSQTDRAPCSALSDFRYIKATDNECSAAD